jgi:hypothetical protein
MSASIGPSGRLSLGKPEVHKMSYKNQITQEFLTPKADLYHLWDVVKSFVNKEKITNKNDILQLDCNLFIVEIAEIVGYYSPPSEIKK